MITTRVTTGLIVLFVAGCAGEATDISTEERSDDSEEWHTPAEPESSFDTETDDSSPRKALPTALLDCPDDTLAKCNREFVVHEWGTFTAVQSSEGEYLEGLHHEEEALPNFVHRLGTDGLNEPALTTKGLANLPEPVTQKMETPVIYFYTDEPKTVDVSVQFPEGVISEWYPAHHHHHAASRWRTELLDGGMDWTVEITNESQSLPRVSSDDIWAPSRQVPDAAFVSHGSEHEKFIFYRGIGTFAPPFSTRHDGHRHYFENHSSDTIPGAYFLEVDENEGRVEPVGPIDGFDTVEFVPGEATSAMKPLDTMVQEAKAQLQAGLAATGLTENEAWAMVDTWEESYFRTPGKRILYILPNSWTQTLLPMKVEPEPDEIVRTLVGRVEVLTPSDEQAIVDEIRRVYEEPTATVWDLADHRFSEPRIRRGCELVDDESIEQWCLEAANQLSRYPEIGVTW